MISLPPPKEDQMKEVTKAMFIMALFITVLVGSSMLVDDSNAQDVTDESNAQDVTDLAALINGLSGDPVNVVLEKDKTYTIDGNNTISKKEVFIDGDDATVSLSAAVQFNAGYNPSTNPNPSLEIKDLKFESDNQMNQISFYNWSYLTISECEFNNVLLFSGGTSNSGVPLAVLEDSVFRESVSDTRYAVTLGAKSISVDRNHIDGYGREININPLEDGGPVTVKDNELSNLNHSEKPIAFQICNNVSNRTVLFSGNAVRSDCIGLSIYHNFSAQGPIVLLDNEFSGCKADILYSSTDAGTDQKYSTDILSINNSFMHDGASSDPTYLSENPPDPQQASARCQLKIIVPYPVR